MPDQTSIRFVIADDHPIFRDGLRRLLQSEPGFEVVGEANDGIEAIQLVESLHPDILLLDLAMPRCPGLETLRQLANSNSRVKTILLTAAIDNQQIVAALQSGARGVVLKDSATQVLLTSIRAVQQGGAWVGRDSVPSLTDYVKQRQAPRAEKKQQRPYGLTNRELEIVAAIAEGCTNREIAEKFKLSEDTVKHHLTNIFDKTGSHNRLELALLALNERFLS